MSCVYMCLGNRCVEEQDFVVKNTILAVELRYKSTGSKSCL